MSQQPCRYQARLCELTSVDEGRSQDICFWRGALDCLADVMQAEVEGHVHKLLTHSCQMADDLIACWIQLPVVLHQAIRNKQMNTLE